MVKLNNFAMEIQQRMDSTCTRIAYIKKAMGALRDLCKHA
jgi:hypothetical protein